MYWFRKNTITEEPKQRLHIKSHQLENLDKDGAKFLFEHAEKLLKETHDTNSVIASRTTTLLTLVVGLMVGLTGFTINRIDKTGNIDNLSQTALYGFVYLLYVAVRLSVIIKPKDFHAIGAYPRPFFDSNFFDKKHEDLIVDLYVNEMENYQERIEFNHAINEKRWEIFTTCLGFTVWSPLIFGVLYLLVNLLS